MREACYKQLRPATMAAGGSEFNMKSLQILKPRRLRSGSVVGVVSLSAPIAADCPRRFERGCEALARLGYEVRVSPGAKDKHRYMAGSVENRVRNLVNLWTDPDVDAIVSTIGGTCLHQLLPHLPFELFRRKPKAFIGYSDTTTLHLCLFSMSGLVSFYGPAIMPQFGEFGGLPAYTRDGLTHVVAGDGVGPIQPALVQIEERLSWDKADNRPRELVPVQTRRCLRPGTAHGPLVVANAGCLLLLAGTQYFPDLTGTILLLEDDESETPETLDRYFTQLSQIGVLDKIAALGVGRFPKEVGIDNDTLDDLLLRTVPKPSIPILTGLEFGHVDPMATLPIGTRASLDAAKLELVLTESSTTP